MTVELVAVSLQKFSSSNRDYTFSKHAYTVVRTNKLLIGSL